jgi:alkylhydroperoxidase family enzyme
MAETADTAQTGFLRVPETTPAVQRLYDGDVDDRGYVMNLSKLWAHDPEAKSGLVGLMERAVRLGRLTFRQRAILITACASTIGDSYCSLAWGGKLSGEADADLAGGVLRGDDALLDEDERLLARWARQVARDPNATTPADVQALRDVGFDDEQVFAMTLFVALRLAFSTVNDALGAMPDRALGESAPSSVRDAVTFGRPVAN